MAQKKVLAFLGLGSLAIASVVYLQNEPQDEGENPAAEESVAVATPSTVFQASQQSENRNAPNAIATAQALPQENAGTETTLAEMRQMFSDASFSKRPSGEVIAKFKAMGFQFTEKKSSNPYTGNRQVLDLSAPHKGFTRLQIQYGSDASHEILEGIRFSVSSHHFESFVNDIVGNASNLKPIQNSETGAVYETPNGYRLWLKKSAGKTPSPQGENSDIMTGGFEPLIN